MDELTKRFIAELEARGGVLLEQVGEDVYRVRLTAGEAIISLDNLRRDVARDGDLDAVARFVAAFAKAPRGVADWPQAQRGLRWALETRSIDLSSCVHEELTPQLAAVLCYTDEHEELVTWIGPSKLKGWKIDVAEAKRLALANMDALLADTAIEIDTVRGAQLGMLATHSVFKASLLLAPSLKARVEESLGWPLLAVAPCRDFAYLFVDDDLISPMGSTVIREHKDGGHPLSTEVLRVTDGGLEALGAFGPPPDTAS